MVSEHGNLKDHGSSWVTEGRASQRVLSGFKLALWWQRLHTAACVFSLYGAPNPVTQDSVQRRRQNAFRELSPFLGVTLHRYQHLELTETTCQLQFTQGKESRAPVLKENCPRADAQALTPAQQACKPSLGRILKT